MTAERDAERPARRPEPLRGRIVLVVGAGDPGAQALALHLSAHGAALVVAGPHLPAVLVTAGLAAASGATARVVEAASPPLLGAALMDAARRVYDMPTDLVVAAASFSSVSAAQEALRALAAALPPGVEAILVDAQPAGGAKLFASATAERILERARARNASLPASREDG